MAHFLDDLRQAFAAFPDRPALCYRGRTIAYRDLERLVERAAAWLQAAGVGVGDRVALFTDDKLPLLVAQLGVTWCGGVAVPLNPRFTREEMRYFLTDSGARAIVAGTEQLALLEGLRADLPALQAILASPDVLTRQDAAWQVPRLAAADPALIIYSSGTTGWPKGVVHTHANAGASLRALAECWRIRADDVVLNVLPLFHIHGLAFATHLSLLSGACVRLEDAFEPQRTLQVARECTVVMAVPTIYYRWLDEPAFRQSAGTWGRVRLFTCGSAPIRPEVLPELERILGRPIINRYGMSEAYVITSLPLEGPWPLGSVGRALDGVEVAVVRDDREPCAAGEVGTVVIRGVNLFREYWGKPEATAAAMAAGWFDTGDLGSLDAAGFLTLAGRKNDLIITHGFNVYPQVVERVINDCPGVRECAVLGVPDPDRGERVVAAVVRADDRLTEDGLRSWLQDRLVIYQQPKQVVFVEALPRNSLGKVLRRELRETLASAGDRAQA